MATKQYYSGLSGSGKAYFVLEQLKDRAMIVVVASEDDLPSWQGNLAALAQLFDGPPVYTFQSQDSFGRINTLKSISEKSRGVIVTTRESLGETTIAPETFESGVLKIDPGQEYDFEQLLAQLAGLGYQCMDFVEERGQFSKRGEVLDIWSPDQNLPWRLVFNFNSLESLRQFDVVTQRSNNLVARTEILPAKDCGEAYLSRYLAPGAAVYFDAPPDGAIPAAFQDYDWLINDPLYPGPMTDVGYKAFVRWGGNYRLFIDELNRLRALRLRIMLFASNEGEKERMEDILAEYRVHDPDISIFIGPLVEGFFSPSRMLAVFSSQEIMYQRRPVSFPKFKAGRRLEGLWEIAPGDYVVHEKYGIGRYLGLRRIARGEQESEYLCIEYKGGDKLYVPPDDFRVVQKYVGVEGYRPRLFSLDTFAWERAKQRAKESAQEVAEQLLKLYAARHVAQGHAYSLDNHWERELADAFPYQETEDQLKAIADVKADLEKPHPMERLICGDVGFGKTEVAIRAAFKVVQDSRQVAILVPTTVLAEQHFNTFSARLAPFPVKVKLLSRFQSKQEQKDVVEAAAAGTVDIVIGTHRLLQKDISFHDLGLLIIDEEHRFGVKQKEKIKSLRKNVDVLLLSATPIPRTLSLALSSLRDLSVIETPPYGRLPIETHLGPYEGKTVKRIIEAELSRGGQVFYVYNRVETILSRARYLHELIPGIRWGVVHGQLPAAEIEKAMWKFLHRETDVLIATTIIESGLDIPTVNTMIVEEAENFGLAQLYQLRGRVGRERQKAYCYLFYTPEMVTEESRKRLQALQEFSELGSGFRLALRDMEIRGAGNILSARQHGFVREIGFELYSRLLDDASKRLRGGATGQSEEQEYRKTVIDFSLPAFLPPEYVEAEDVRIMFYRRLGGARFAADLRAVKDELEDRFGRLPEAVGNLLALADLRLAAEKAGVKSIVEDARSIVIYFGAGLTFTPENILALAGDYAGLLEFVRGEEPGVRFNKANITGPVVAAVKEFVNRLDKYAIPLM